MNNQIKCPNCGHQFDVEAALSGELEAHYKKEYERKAAALADKANQATRNLEIEKQQLILEKEKIEERIKKEISEKIQSERAKIQKSTREDFEAEMKALVEENNKRKSENKALKMKEVALMQMKAKLEEQQEEMEMQLEKKMLERQKGIEIRTKRMLEERFAMERAQMKKQLEDQKKLAEEAVRKAKQGSMQLQGEVQELAIEEYLRNQFPLDTIDEIKKGVLGGDTLQTIHTRARQNCGTIYYESKRTKSFQPSWIEKFKHDLREKGADLGVIVTEAMPVDMSQMGQKDGIWICSFAEFKGLCHVLRKLIIDVSNASASQENKGDKMAMLYEYLSGNEFRGQIEAIVEGFTQMKVDIDKEKRAMMSIWKRREKQIEKVLLNTNYMYSSVKGIAGKVIQPISALELGDGEDAEIDIIDNSETN